MTRILLILLLLHCCPRPCPAQTLPVSWQTDPPTLTWDNPDSITCLVYEQHSDRWWRQAARTRGDSYPVPFGRRTHLQVWMCSDRSLCRECVPQTSALFLDWSQGVEVTMLKVRGDSVDVLAVYLPYGPWNLQWMSIRPDTVEAWFEYDFVMDGFVDISDFSYFSQGYKSIYDLSDLSIFGAMYEKQALIRYEGVME